MKKGKPAGTRSMYYLVSDRDEYELPLFIGTADEVGKFLGVTEKSVIEMCSRDAGAVKITAYNIKDLEEDTE